MLIRLVGHDSLKQRSNIFISYVWYKSYICDVYIKCFIVPNTVLRRLSRRFTGYKEKSNVYDSLWNEEKVA